MEQTLSSGGGTEASAPATFAEAFAAEASPASDPSTSSTTPADAVTPPTTSEATPAPDDRSPFIPRTRFDEVNARMQAAETFRQAHAWAEGLNASEVQQLVEFRNALKADPLSTMTQEFAVLAQHPVYGPQLRSWAARQLASGRQLAAQPEPPGAAELTPIPIQLEDGRVVQVLPADQLDTFKARILAEAQQQFQPAMDAAKELQQAKQLAVAQQQAHTFATGFLQELRTLPQFKEHELEIKAALAQTRLETDHPAEVKAAMHAIYNRLVLPKLTQATESRVLDSLQQKAAASTAVNPGSATPSSPRTVTRFDQLGPEAWR